MAAYENILYEKQRNGVLTTFNRPEAMNATSDELHTALEDAAADPEVRSSILTGTRRASSAGYDIRGGDQGGFAWPDGLPEGKSVAEVIDDWRDRA